jgi:hypothetical protein
MEVGCDPRSDDGRRMGGRRTFPEHPVPARWSPFANHRRVTDGILWICRAGATCQSRSATENRSGDSSTADVSPASGMSCCRGSRIAAVTGKRCRRSAAAPRSGGAAEPPTKTEDFNFWRLGVLAAGSPQVDLRCSAVGLPIGVVLVARDAHDATAYNELMKQQDSDPYATLADKGNDRVAIRHDSQDRAIFSSPVGLSTGLAPTSQRLVGRVKKLPMACFWPPVPQVVTHSVDLWIDDSALSETHRDHGTGSVEKYVALLNVEGRERPE